MKIQPFALAVAQRESAFDPTAHSSKTIHGLYQTMGLLRQKYGVSDFNDPRLSRRGLDAVAARR